MIWVCIILLAVGQCITAYTLARLARNVEKGHEIQLEWYEDEP